jgi:hypothetical protein
MNDVIVNRKKIARYLGEHIKTVKDRAYTIEEIKKIVDASSIKYKIIVTLMASSGCRIGAIRNLVLRNLKYYDEYQLYQITFYENSREEYFSFCTPECSNYIREYLQFRERCGEKLKPSSPLIRTDFQQNDLLHIENPKFLSLDSHQKYLRYVLVKVGIRIRTNPLPNKKRERKEISQNHGFRKFTMTTMSHARISPEIREMLLGHSIGLGDSYYRPNVNEMLFEYLKVVNDLTIDPSHRLQKQVQELKEKEDYKNFLINNKLKEMAEQNQLLTSQLNDIAKQIQEIHYTRKKLDPDTLHKFKTGTKEERSEIVDNTLYEMLIVDKERREKQKQELAQFMIKQGELTEEQWRKQEKEEEESKAGKRRREMDKKVRENFNRIRNERTKTTK